jgi:hypothetical protein
MMLGKPDDVYLYRNGCGQVLYEVVRFPGKEFRIRRPNGDGTYTWNLDGIPRVPYRLEEIVLADEAFFVEGEKDVETLRRIDIVASTNTGGSGGWQKEFAEYFRGKRVVVLPDQDEPGYKWAGRVLSNLYGIAGELKRVDLPGPAFGSGADVTDWLNSGHTKKDLCDLVGETPLWEPAGARENALLRKLENLIARFLILPEGSLLPLAAWVLATFAFETFEAFPYLCVLSPTKQCGKTRLTEVLGLLAANAYRTVNISEAALFRLIEEHKPTLILDEAEALTGKSDRAEAIRSLLNAGNRRNTTVPRCQGNSHELKFFSIYCPKVVVAIGTCPDTIRDRSIVLLMQRRKPGESVERFLARRVEPETQAMREELKSFIIRSNGEIQRAYETLDLDFLQDRDAEAWEPLFAVIEVADPSRWDELRRCALKLTGDKTATDIDDTLSLKLLTDLNAIWPDDQSAAFTSELIGSLKAIEESPWQAEVELNPRKLARLLRPFGIEPKQVRVAERTAKGYDLEDLDAAFSRYLGSKGKHAKQPA